MVGGEKGRSDVCEKRLFAQSFYVGSLKIRHSSCPQAVYARAEESSGK